LRVYALKSILDLRYQWFAHIFFFSFCERKNMLKENKKTVSPDFYLSPSIYIYTCVLRTPHGIYVYYHYSTSGFLLGSPGVSSRHLGSHPSTPHAVCVCTYTHTHNTYTSTSCKKWGDTSITQTNPSHWKQTPTVDQLENPCSPLFYIRMQ